MTPKEIVKNLSVVFVGPVRNGAPYLDKIFENIERIGGLFKNYSCVFVESDSSDNSLQILNKFKYKHDNNIHILSLGNLESHISSRTCRIAAARNAGIVFCEKNNILDTHDYYIHMCMDEVNSDKMLEDDFLSCFLYDINTWAGMTANQLTYYDLWCLRCKGWLDYDCWFEVSNRPSYMTFEDAHNMHVKSKFIKIPKNYGLIEVDAAHGGFGIFKSSYAKGARYRGHNDNNSFEECDLINFCRHVRAQNGKIFINSQLINHYNYKNKHDT